MAHGALVLGGPERASFLARALDDTQVNGVGVTERAVDVDPPRAACYGVVEFASCLDVVAGQNIVPDGLAALARADLGRGLADGAAFETGLLPQKGPQLPDLLADPDLSLGQVTDLGRITGPARHVRRVLARSSGVVGSEAIVIEAELAACHRPSQRLARCGSLCLGDTVDPADVDEGAHRLHATVKVAALGRGSAGPVRQVGVAGPIDIDLGPQGLAPALALHDQGLDLTVLDEGARGDSVQPELDTCLVDHLIGDTLECFGVKADAPFLACFLPGQGAVQGVHALGQLFEEALDDGGVCAGGGMAQDRCDQAGGGEAAQEAIALDEEHFGPMACGGDRGGEAARATTGDDHVDLGGDRELALGFNDHVGHG